MSRTTWLAPSCGADSTSKSTHPYICQHTPVYMPAHQHRYKSLSHFQFGTHNSNLIGHTHSVSVESIESSNIYKYVTNKNLTEPIQNDGFAIERTCHCYHYNSSQQAASWCLPTQSIQQHTRIYMPAHTNILCNNKHQVTEIALAV